MRLVKFLVPAVVVLLVAAAVVLFVDTRAYRVTVALPEAPNLIKGGTVLVNGFEAGSIADIAVKDGKAVLDLSINHDVGPLHQGATVKVGWRAVLGERELGIEDGPENAPTIPDGGTIQGEMPDPVEVDRVLSALDPPTRAHLAGLVKNLDGTLKGQEQNVNQTIATAGPTLDALGNVMRGLGDDGPAINNLVTRTSDVVDVLVKRDQDVRTIVSQLTASSQASAAQSDQIAATLQRLPHTLTTATNTLDDVPGTVDKTVPLLDDLRPVTDKLPQFSKNLSPVLANLRPAAAQLRPTLQSLSNLLDYTPALLDSAHAVAPGTDKFLSDVQPALPALRPYTPELVGWLSNWGSATANYDVNGHYMRSSINEGPTSLNADPGIIPPGISQDPYPVPGSLENQPWTDAFGSAAR